MEIHFPVIGGYQASSLNVIGWKVGDICKILVGLIGSCVESYPSSLFAHKKASPASLGVKISRYRKSNVIGNTIQFPSFTKCFTSFANHVITII